MLNIGERPTILDDRHVIEVYIFDFSADIYGADITIEFVEKIRDEKKFNDIGVLKSQLKIDAINCKQIFKL
jgi:riboflavin kinase/FMN adenylyltransferase